ncbi:hypothetical protein MMC13_005272 [Lambiella insularis]|nr:hypothetical protein [Lambiella insularis]
MSFSVFRLILDAHSAFPIPAKSASSARTLTKHWSDTPAPSRTLALLSVDEQEAVLRFYRPEDAALALGSCLLKRVAVARGAGVTWNEAGIGMKRAESGKPMWKGGDDCGSWVEFNVSHHGTMVVLVAAAGARETAHKTRKVGIDVVRVDTVKDSIAVKREGGFDKWVRIFENVFPATEVRHIVSYSASNGASTTESLEANLRRFYAHWSLREAYVKVSGEALVAPWLKKLEFREVKVPGKGNNNYWGECTTGIEVWLGGKKIEKIGVELQALGEEYIIATAMEGMGECDKFTDFDEVELERDIIPLAAAP